LHQFLAMDMLTPFFEGCLVTPMEAIFYIAIVTVMTLMRLCESCLVNTFTFAYYWGFKSLLQTISVANADSDHTILLYFVSGLMVFTLLHLSYIRARYANASTQSPPNQTESMEAAS